MKKHYNQLFKQTSLSYSVLGSRNLSQRVLPECLLYQVPMPKLLLLKVATDVISSPPPPTSLSENTFPSTKCKSKLSEQRKTAVFHIQKKEGNGRREKGEVFKFRYLLTETQNTHTQALHRQKSQQSGLWSFASSQRLPQASQEFSPSLTGTQKRTEDRSEVPTKVYLRFNESVIHYNKSQCNINTCRKNRLSTAPQQMLVLIQHNKTLADHRKKKVRAIPLSKSKA